MSKNPKIIEEEFNCDICGSSPDELFAFGGYSGTNDDNEYCEECFPIDEYRRIKARDSVEK